MALRTNFVVSQCRRDPTPVQDQMGNQNEHEYVRGGGMKLRPKGLGICLDAECRKQDLRVDDPRNERQDEQHRREPIPEVVNACLQRLPLEKPCCNRNHPLPIEQEMDG